MLGFSSEREIITLMRKLIYFVGFESVGSIVGGGDGVGVLIRERNNNVIKSYADISQFDHKLSHTN